MDLELLKEIGLTDSETKVYLALLELGSSTKGPIVDKSGVASSKIYELLEKLVQKGLVSFMIQSGVKHFEAAPPDRIMDYLAEKESKLSVQKEKLKEMMPQLELRRQMSKYKSEAQIFKGNKGWKTAFDDIINTLQKGDRLMITGISKFDPEFKRMIYHWHVRRAKKGIKADILLNYAAREIGEKLIKLSNTKVKYMQKGMVTPAVFLIYGQKTLISLPNQRTFLRIENEEATKAFKSYFETIWSQDTTVSKGWDALHDAFYSIPDQYKEGEHYEIIGAGFGEHNVEKKYSEFFRKYHKYRQEKGVGAKLLFYQKHVANEKYYKENFKGKDGIQMKYLPYGSSVPVPIIPLKDKTIMITQDENPTVITINNKNITNAFHEHFKSLWEQDVTVATGMDKVHNAWDRMLDELKTGEEYYVMSASWHGQKKKVPEYFKNFHQRRIDKKVKAKFLFTAGTKAMLKNVEKYYYTYSEVKFLPKTIYEGMQINMYNNKVLFLVWREKEPIVITIEDPTVYKTFKTYFDTSWGQETYIIRGLDAVQQLFEDMLESGEGDFIGARGYFVDERPKFIEDWEKRCIKKGFKLRNIVDKETKGHKITKFKFAQTKYTLPKEFAPLSVFWIFGDKVAISNWTEKEPIVTVINNKGMYDLYKKQFETLWNKGKDLF